MLKLSIVVPVYGAEVYLERCVNSILSQSFRDWELLLVDDGSPDRCPEMCDEYAERDDRIRTIHQENQGVAAARNRGIRAAEGEYITFVDSDDWIESDMYQNMMQKIREYDCDLVLCDCMKDHVDHSELYSHDIRGGFYNETQMKEEYTPQLLMMENIEYPATISNCLCMIRRDILRNNDLQYIPGVRFSEDLLFGAQAAYYSRSLFYMKGEAFYHYVMNPASATHSFREDKWKDYRILYTEACRFFPMGQRLYRKQTDRMLLFFVYNAVGDVLGSSLSVPDKRRIVYSILKEDIVREMFRRTGIPSLKISNKLKIITAIYKYRIGLGLLLHE